MEHIKLDPIPNSKEIIERVNWFAERAEEILKCDYFELKEKFKDLKSFSDTEEKILEKNKNIVYAHKHLTIYKNYFSHLEITRDKTLIQKLREYITVKNIWFTNVKEKM
ncbi:hypothetical protein KAR50_05120 [Periweissella fabaria]|uniref:Uncharacterized protein n=1 Tax=Periweissella fabaria TaxID=546157 RepID=A0ABM8Z508_9LACO|nr:hypothetical protein [Periweissella fabaria]MCM0597221.1 hypothetical protein [Periweissella fabaria]CAH0416273.1 hypothetical protein WFA24289_00572 [Periweissella fabaria]